MTNDLGTRGHELVGDQLQLLARALETGHASVDGLPSVSVDARPVVAVGPVARVAIERDADPGEGVVGVGQAGVVKRPLDCLASLRTPGVGQHAATSLAA